MSLQRTPSWAGLRPGDAVTVDAGGVGMRAASWEFVAHVRSSDTGDEWIEVVGGKRGDRKVRSFPPESVYPPHARPGAATAPPSLAQGPRLPFD